MYLSTLLITLLPNLMLILALPRFGFYFPYPLGPPSRPPLSSPYNQNPLSKDLPYPNSTSTTVFPTLTLPPGLPYPFPITGGSSGCVFPTALSFVCPTGTGFAFPTGSGAIWPTASGGCGLPFPYPFPTGSGVGTVTKPAFLRPNATTFVASCPLPTGTGTGTGGLLPSRITPCPLLLPTGSGGVYTLPPSCILPSGFPIPTSGASNLSTNSSSTALATKTEGGVLPTGTALPYLFPFHQRDTAPFPWRF